MACYEDSNDQSNHKAAQITIPRSSFTAFRLLYGEAGEISHVSKTLLLGAVPKIWFKEQNSGFLRTLTQATSRHLKNGIDEVYDAVHYASGFPSGQNSMDPLAKKYWMLDTHLTGDGMVLEENKSRHVNTGRDNSTPKLIISHASDETNINNPETVSKSQGDSATENFKKEFKDNNKVRKTSMVSSSTHFTKQNTVNELMPEPSRINSVYSLTSDPYSESEKESHVSQNSRRTVETHLTLLKPIPTSCAINDAIGNHHETLSKVRTATSVTKRKIHRNLRHINQQRFLSKITRHYKTGEIIKMERMLVMVKMAVNQHDLSQYRTFTDVEPCDTRVLERWKEFFVVARSSGDADEPILLQFYTKREIPHTSTSKHVDDSLDFTLTRRCLINFYNTLDKTISIVKGSQIYILRGHTPISSIRWLSFLNQALGIVHDQVLDINLPRFNLSVTLDISPQIYDVYKLDEAKNETKITIDRKGYSTERSPIFEWIIDRLRTRMMKNGFSDIIKYWEDQRYLVALCWRQYDRLEWLFGENLRNIIWQQSMTTAHVLEIRRVEHYPKTVVYDSKSFEEPSPIEGFLIRLNTATGRTRSGVLCKQVCKFDYFHTSSNMLFFGSFFEATPPFPDTFMDLDSNRIDKEAFEKIRLPEIYEHNPYSVDETGHFTWLNSETTSEEFTKNDRLALYEFERRITMISRADGVIDLLEIESISPIEFEEMPLAVKITSNLLWYQIADSKTDSLSLNDSFFAINFQNGARMVLKAPYTKIRDEWIKRLNDLRFYWRLRIKDDLNKIFNVKQENIKKLQIDDFTEANDDENAPKWENSKGTADPSVYNISTNAMFRPVVRSGYLYQKPKKHSAFRKFFVVLSPGYIILFSIYSRTLTGLSKPSNHYQHYITIPISHCYIYSGKITELDLLDRDFSEYDSINPGRHSLPRAYDDGWLSSDDEPSRCFTLWFGTKRAIAGHSNYNKTPDGLMKTSQLQIHKNPGMIRLVNRLGVTGQTMVFMCRSRQERDLWVENLNTEIERFGDQNSLEEVTLKTSKE